MSDQAQDQSVESLVDVPGAFPFVEGQSPTEQHAAVTSPERPVADSSSKRSTKRSPSAPPKAMLPVETVPTDSSTDTAPPAESSTTRRTVRSSSARRADPSVPLHALDPTPFELPTAVTLKTALPLWSAEEAFGTNFDTSVARPADDDADSDVEEVAGAPAADDAEEVKEYRNQDHSAQAAVAFELSSDRFISFGSLAKQTDKDFPDAAVRFCAHLHEAHQSHFRVKVDISEVLDTHLSDTHCTDLQMWSANLVDLQIEMVISRDNVLNVTGSAKLNGAQVYDRVCSMFNVTPKILNVWLTHAPVMHLSLIFKPGVVGGKVGKNFYNDHIFPGESGAALETVRQFYDTAGKDTIATIHIIVFDDGGTFLSQVRAAAASIKQQPVTNACNFWFKNGKVNCQKGMELSKSLRPKYVTTLDKRYNFFSSDEYLLIQYYNTIEQAELAKAQVTSRYLVRVRFASLPYKQKDVVFAFVQKSTNYNLSTDDRISLSLDASDDLPEARWSGVVMAHQDFGVSNDYTVLLRRPWFKTKIGMKRHGQFSEYQIPEKYMITSEDQKRGVVAMRKKLGSMPAMRVEMHVATSDRDVQRQINTLRVIQQNPDRFAAKLDALTANNLRGRLSTNAYQKLVDAFGAEAVQARIAQLFAGHNQDQRAATVKFQQLPGSILCIDGAPGTGKSTWVTDQSLLLHSFSTKKKHFRLLYTSPANNLVDDMCVKMQNKLMEQFDSGLSTKYPVVIRVYSQGSEQAITLRPMHQQVTANRLAQAGSRPESELEDYTSGLDEADLIATKMMVDAVQSLRPLHEGVPDRRVTSGIELSLAAWMSRRAGMLQPDGKVHPIARGVPKEEYQEYRQYFAQLKLGKPTSETVTNFKAVCRTLRADVIQLADVLGTTLSNITQQSVHNDGDFEFAVVDEANSATEVKTLAVWTFVTARALVLVGDQHQMPPPIVVPETIKDEKIVHPPFWRFVGVSQHKRFLRNGFAVQQFRYQQRCAPDIARALRVMSYNTMHSGNLTHLQPLLDQCKSFAVKLFGKDSNLVVVDVGSGTDSKATSGDESYFNMTTLKVVWSVLIQALLVGNFRPEEIGILSGYRKQNAQHVSTRANAVKYFKDEAAFIQASRPDLWVKFNQFVKSHKDVEIFTIDGAAGREKKVIILDLVRCTELGFLLQNERINTAVSRAIGQIIIVGNIQDVLNHYAQTKDKKAKGKWADSVIKNLLNHCSRKRLVFKLDDTNRGKFVVPFAVEPDYSIERDDTGLDDEAIMLAQDVSKGEDLKSFFDSVASKSAPKPEGASSGEAAEHDDPPPFTSDDAPTAWVPDETPSGFFPDEAPSGFIPDEAQSGFTPDTGGHDQDNEPTSTDSNVAVIRSLGGFGEEPINTSKGKSVNWNKSSKILKRARKNQFDSGGESDAELSEDPQSEDDASDHEDDGSDHEGDGSDHEGDNNEMSGAVKLAVESEQSEEHKSTDEQPEEQKIHDDKPEMHESATSHESEGGAGTGKGI